MSGGGGGGSVGGFAEGSKGKSKAKNRIQVPKWLRPFVEQSLGSAERGLSGLEGALSGDQVADFTPEQLAAFQSALGVAGGEGGFLPAAQQAFMNAAQGGSSMDPDALAALQGTARGDFLYGGEGFDAAVQAAVDAANPQIASAFGGTAGGLSGGLARQAVGDTAVNAFASQFGNERRNQIGAANALGGFGQQDANRQIMAAGQLPGLGLLPSQIMGEVGGQIQGQAQNEIQGPADAYARLLNAALSGGSGFGNFLGSTQKGGTQTFAQGIQGSGGKG